MYLPATNSAVPSAKGPCVHLHAGVLLILQAWHCVFWEAQLPAPTLPFSSLPLPHNLNTFFPPWVPMFSSLSADTVNINIYPTLYKTYSVVS